MNDHTIGRTTAPARSAHAAPAIFLQRKCACGGSPGVSGTCEESQEKPLQRKAATANSLGAVPLSVSATVRGSGQPLVAHTREYMVGRFGHHVGQLRIHHDAAPPHS